MVFKLVLPLALVGEELAVVLALVEVARVVEAWVEAGVVTGAAPGRH